MQRTFILWLLSTTLVLGGCNCPKEQCSTTTKPKNIIVLIGDGMGLAQATAAMQQKNSPLNLERSHFIGLSKTYSANDYVTDSAAGGTAIACGTKTKNGMIGMNADSVAVESMLEAAERNGLATGIVVTCGLTHATPAAFVAHQINRNMSEEIAADYMTKEIDVCIGGDRKAFDDRKDGRNLLVELADKGYTIANGMDEIMQTKSGKLMGFVEGNAYDMPKMPDRGDMLPNGVATALHLLSQNEQGFFLMVEGSQIDWGGHGNDINYVINELIDFDNAVGKAIDFAEQDGNTLVIVTADHETGGLTLPQNQENHTTYTAHFSTGNHTGCMVPIYTYGAGAEAFAGIMENTAIKGKVLELLGIK